MFWPRTPTQTDLPRRRKGEISLKGFLLLRFDPHIYSKNGWVQFTGDQLGALFAARVLQHYQKSGKSVDNLAMVASTVSSKMVEKMAQVEGFTFKECLTG
jgi:hypothetical protein